LLQDFAPSLVPGAVYGRNGRDYVWRNLRKYNAAARYWPWIVLADLETDECPPSLIDRFLPDPEPYLLLRIAVRSSESWLLGDSERFAELLRVPVTRVPTSPDEIGHPKAAVVALARRSHSRIVQRALVPQEGYSATQGPQYMAYLASFVADRSRGWRPERAAEASPSLRAAIAALRLYAETVSAQFM
jgi:hypothetical protein